MTWRKSTLKEERYRFVEETLNPQSNKTFIEICKEYNISSKTGYKWLNRFHLYGLTGLDDQSRARKTHQNKISHEVEKCIIEIRNNHKTLGPKKIHAIINQNYPDLQVPSISTIGNVLHENNLTKQRYYRKHVAKTSPLGNCLKPNDIWMYDFKGWFLTQNGKRCEPLTITDGFSRYALGCVHMPRKREEDVWDVLKEIFIEHGLPLKMRSDNGPPFASLGIGRLSKLAIKLIKLGITPEWIEPGHPEQNGRHERFHLTFKEEVASPPATTLPLQIAKNKNFINFYNNERPHEALGQISPAKVYQSSERKWNGEFKSPEYNEEYEVRYVCKGGNISWKGHNFFLSETLWKEPIGIKQIAWDIMGLYYGPIYLGTIDFTKGFKRAK